MERFQLLVLGVGGNRSAWRKPTGAGMELVNQIHIGKGKCLSTNPTCLATGVVCHPDTEQNRPSKSPGHARNWTGDLLHRKQELYQYATLLLWPYQYIIQILTAHEGNGGKLLSPRWNSTFAYYSPRPVGPRWIVGKGWILPRVQ